MKIILRLALVVSLFLLLNGEPPKQATAQEPSVIKVATPVTTPKAVDTTSITPTPTPTPEPVIRAPKDIAKATLNDLGLSDSWYAVDFIVSHESSWNPTVLNSIGACGLFQALPCSKLPCELPDVACQVRWATNYANQRYGSWHNAYNFWVNNKYW